MPSRIDRVPKLCGADVELGNFILGTNDERTGAAASRALLREIDGLPARQRDWAQQCVNNAPSPPLDAQPDTPTDTPPLLSANVPACSRANPSSTAPHPSSDSASPTDACTSSRAPNPQDWGRKYLATNGGCAYIDLDHLELCTPEVVSAWDHVAAWHAMLRIARRALTAANTKLPAGQKIQALVNNSDGRSNAYGSHLSFLVTRRAWQNLFERRMHYLLYLAAYQVSSIVFTGQGKVGAENGAPRANFQIAQRADFFETLVGSQTTYRRPIVNARDEGLCGESRSYRAGAAGPTNLARVHCIFFDNTLCHVATLLKVGVMQIVLAMIEAEQIDPRLVLDEPLEALVAWSHDPGLRQRARTTSGRQFTAVELQLCFLEQARRFVEAGGCEGIVPRAAEILSLWEDTLERLRACDFESLARRLDWVLKLSVLRRAAQRRTELTWTSPEMKLLDHLYASLSEDEGLHWAYAASGAVDHVVADGDIARFEAEPPADTRAWTRAMLLRAAGPERVDDVDWNWVRVVPSGRIGGWDSERIELANPLGFTKTEAGYAFVGSACLEHVLQRLRPPAARSRHGKLIVVAGTTVH